MPKAANVVMNRILGPVLLGLAGVASISAAPLAAQAQPAAFSDSRLAGLEDFVDGVMAEQIASREIAGAVVTVVHDGEVLFSRGYGYADVDAREPVDGMATLFRPGSVSKLFTWVALMQQVEQGRVDLDADVNRYLDFEIPEFGSQPIRVRDLLQHTPGMSDIGGISVRTEAEITPYRDWIKANIPARLWEAGSEISYSNYGTALAGYIVERLSGEPFETYVEKHVFQPLGMTSTTFREPLTGTMKENMATGYTLEDGRFVAMPYEFFSPVMPAGSAAASGPDMARFMLMLLDHGSLAGAKVLEPASIDLLFSNSTANAPDLEGMAHGFLVYRNEGPRLIGHAGNTRDFHSNLVLAPEHDLGFFVSTTGGVASGAGRTDLSDILIGRLFPQEPAERWSGEDAGAALAGSYRANRRDYNREPNPDNDLKVTAPAPNRLVLKTGENATAWKQIGPRMYEQVTAAREGGPYTRLQFYGPADDLRLSFSNQPYMTYHHVEAAD
ncbi:serine hydrolase domain-containing protein [Qipengyuania sp. MTN3-11]|uniref:serine hydrolase domain-containing protein n=1 Tax=Qipengyuania sp. MTN3-11 TaxID=3056557 RepID=UPI0036F24C21